MSQPELSERAAAAFNSANAAYKQGDFAQALKDVEVALAETEGFVFAHLLKARCLNQQGALDTAKACYQNALQFEPENFSAHLELGNVQRRAGDVKGAKESYRRAIMSRPGDHRGHLSLARLIEEIGGQSSEDQAAHSYHRALATVGANRELLAMIHQTIGRARLSAARPGAALDAFRQALSHLDASDDRDADGDAEMLIDMAKAMLRIGLEQEAEKALERAARAEAPEVLRSVALVCYDANFWQDGIAVLRRAVALHPEDVDGHLALADLLSRCWQFDDAEAAIAKAEKLAPVQPAQRLQLLGKIASSRGDADAALEHFQALQEAGQDYAMSSVAMTSLYSAKLSAQEKTDLHKRMCESLGNMAVSAQSLAWGRDPDRTLRIGMVTGDMHRQHPVNLFMQPILARWPHDEWPLTVYFTGSSYDAQTRLAKSRAGTWREVSIEVLPTRVAADEIDILIDLAGHTSFRTLRKFAQRMAPVQVAYLGYPGTTGCPNMDWIIADPIVAPKHDKGLFRERVAYMPNTVFCFAPEADYPSPKFGAEIEARPLTFGSFNNVPKINEETVALWARAVTALSDARLLLKAPSFQDSTVVQRYTDSFAAHGLSSDRIEFRGPVGLDDMMQEYADVDIGLDPLSYNGGTTTLQAMWMGVPVVTLAGDNFASRMGASFMRAAGLDDFVADSEDAFVAAAASLGADRTTLAECKRGMRARLLERPAWDIDLFVADFVKCVGEIAQQSSNDLVTVK